MFEIASKQTNMHVRYSETELLYVFTAAHLCETAAHQQILDERRHCVKNVRIS